MDPLHQRQSIIVGLSAIKVSIIVLGSTLSSALDSGSVISIMIIFFMLQVSVPFFDFEWSFLPEK